jgi:DNA-binding NtrC family response regulator
MQRFNKNTFKRSVGRVNRLKAIARTLLTELELVEGEDLDEIPPEFDFYEEVKRFEIALIIRALTHSQGHQLEAARLLKLNSSTLNAKIKQYDIQLNAFSQKNPFARLNAQRKNSDRGNDAKAS